MTAQERWDPKVFARRVKQARKSAGLSQEALAEALGIRQATVSAWETGKALPSVEVLAEVSVRLAREPGWLLGIADAVREAGEVTEGDARRAQIELDRVRRRLRHLLTSISGDQAVDHQAVLLFRAEALRQDRLLAKRHGRLAWLAVADSIAEAWLSSGLVTEDDLGLWTNFREVAAAGADLPAVTWREVGMSAGQVTALMGGE